MQPSNSSRVDVTTGTAKRRRTGSFRGEFRDQEVHELPPHLVIQRVLGEGGTSIVYQALHTRLKVPVAVKVLARLEHHQAEAAERLLREAELCARLTDPRFPRIYDVDQLDDGTPYMVMEHISGRTLADLIANGPFEVETAWAITREVLEALMDIHDLGVIHRDIKPANILIETPEGREQRVRIVDFGIAKATDLAAPAEALTEQGAMVGTPHYMAPEQMRGARLDARVDLYAVGSVLYEMLAGKPAFDGGTIGEVIAATLRDDPAPLGTLRDDVPEMLQAFVAKAMSRDRRERYATAHEMLCALHATRVFVASPSLVPPAPKPVTDMVAFAHEESGTRPVATRQVAARPNLLIMPEPLELPADGPRPSSPLDTTSYRHPKRARAVWKAGIAMAALTVPFWPTQLSDVPPVPAAAVVAAPVAPGAVTAPEVQATPERPQLEQAPASTPFSMTDAQPQPIVIVSGEDEEEPRPTRSRRRHKARSAEPEVTAPVAPDAPDAVTPVLRVRTPESLPERGGALPNNPY